VLYYFVASIDAMMDPSGITSREKKEKLLTSTSYVEPSDSVILFPFASILWSLIMKGTVWLT
jgi:hypothetical protein